ncbi:hypothetical protein LY76DRAFT_332665 [Colletotrichum caudatum]|nr:hypothetical protein LY76DRAFT_332665 [Colletotrichum caudatum]
MFDLLHTRPRVYSCLFLLHFFYLSFFVLFFLSLVGSFLGIDGFGSGPLERPLFRRKRRDRESPTAARW